MSKRGTGAVSALYGINAVKEAIGRRPIEYVLVAEGQRGQRIQQVIDACRAAGVSVRFAPRAALERVAGTTQHQNVVALCSARSYDDLAELLPRPAMPGTEPGRAPQPSLLVVLDGVEDPANLGAVIRTTVAAGASGVIIPERHATGLSPAVARSAAGALEHVRIARVGNLVRALVELQERGVWLYGFEPGAAKSYLELDYKVSCALVLGGEGQGIHRLVRETCDQLAAIPLRGPVQSLNVSVAAAIVLYEASRQRGA